MANQLYFEDVKVGDELPPLTKEITSKHLVMYEAATYDFYPGHYDRDQARARGMPDIYADGPMLVGYFGQLVMDWIGNDGRIKKIGGQYRRMVIPGDKLTIRGKVTNKRTAGGENLVDCELRIEKQGEERTTIGSATVSLPSKR